jgi:2'-5' RNA ligase
MPNSPLILTIKMDSESADFLTALRDKYFPPERNYLKAHITLFHHLPGEQLDEIEDYLKIISSRQFEFPLQFQEVKFIGRGTIITVESPALTSLRNKLANQWNDWLTPQDRQKFAAHVTLQNKTEPDEAQKVFAELEKNWQPRTGTATAAQLWHYRDGPWQLANEFDFYRNTDLS